jgi:hypothetical protein
MFTLPEGAVQDVIGYAGQIFTDFSDLILLIVGVFLAITALGILVNIFRK